jgi:hypothetical protein
MRAYADVAHTHHMRSPTYLHCRAHAGATVKKAAGVASIIVALPTPKTLFQVYYRGSWGKGTAQVRQHTGEV